MSGLSSNVERVLQDVEMFKATNAGGIKRIPLLLLPVKMADIDIPHFINLLKDKQLNVTVEGNLPGFPGTGAVVVRL
jgi:hypothetical protein